MSNGWHILAAGLSDMFRQLTAFVDPNTSKKGEQNQGGKVSPLIEDSLGHKNILENLWCKTPIKCVCNLG